MSKTRYNEPEPSPIQAVQTPSGGASPEGEDGKKPPYKSFAWLFEQYVTLGRTCPEISEHVGCDPKTIWKWIKDHGIQTRPRGSYHDRWLPKDGSPHKGRRHSDETRELLKQQSAARIPYLKNGRHWLKEPGARPPNWKGGITPERQTFYRSAEWKAVVKEVWKRDDGRCRRCALDYRTVDRASESFHIHHIDGFQIVDRRADSDNLILVCVRCHRWIHSAENALREFLGRGHEIGIAA